MTATLRQCSEWNISILLNKYCAVLNIPNCRMLHCDIIKWRPVIRETEQLNMYIFAVTLENEGQVGRIALWDAVFHPV